MKRHNKKSDVKVIRLIPENLAAVTGGGNRSVVGGVTVQCAAPDDVAGGIVSVVGGVAVQCAPPDEVLGG
jgi:hypothetical protein